MKVLIVYAHNNPHSFCHGVLERFTDGLRDGGHSSEVVDLYAIKFDPVFRDRDVASYIGGDIPADILDLMGLRGRVMQSCRWPGQRWLAARALRGKSQAEIAALIRSRMPKDVLAQQAKVASADTLAFIAPIHFCNFPSILKGWIDRVWTYDFAFGLTSAGWHGDVNGRIPLLHLWVPKMPSPHTTCEYSWGSRTAAAGPAIRTAGRRSDRADEVTRPIIMPCG
jgi:NAD(P)H dehydrogenase (quinone)